MRRPRAAAHDDSPTPSDRSSKQIGRDDNEIIIAIVRKVRGSKDLGWLWVEYKRCRVGERYTPVAAPTGVRTGCHAGAATSTQATDAVFWSLR